MYEWVGGPVSRHGSRWARLFSFSATSLNLFSVVKRIFPRRSRRQNIFERCRPSTKTFRQRLLVRRITLMGIFLSKTVSAWGRPIILFYLILSLIKFTRIKMFLQGELFCNTRRHKYSYIFIWTLPRFPSLHFPKENCVLANKKCLKVYPNF